MTERLVDPLRLGRPLELERRERDRREPQPEGTPGRKRRASSVTLLLAMLVAALVVVPAAVADDDDDDDGGVVTTQTVVLASGFGPDEFSLDGGQSWQSAVLVTPHPAWAQPIPGSLWISTSSNGSSGNAVLIRYRRIFTIPQGCVGTGLTGLMHADNEATVTVDNVPAGQTTRGIFSFQGQPDPFASAGPFLAGNHTLAFEVGNLGDPNGLDYRAEFTLTCGGGDDDDGDDDGDDDDDDGGDDDD
jgi:hypothetical protein